MYQVTGKRIQYLLNYSILTIIILIGNILRTKEMQRKPEFYLVCCCSTVQTTDCSRVKRKAVLYRREPINIKASKILKIYHFLITTITQT